MTLLLIDKHILARISSLLDIRDVMHLSWCCKSLKRYYDDDDIWNTMYSLNYVRRSNTFYKELYLKQQKKEFTTYSMKKLIDIYEKYTFGFKHMKNIEHNVSFIKNKFHECDVKYIRFFIESFPDLLKNLLFNTEFNTQITFDVLKYTNERVDVITYFCIKNKYDLLKLMFDTFPRESKILNSCSYPDNKNTDKWTPFLLATWDGFFDIAYLCINRYPLETLPSLRYIDKDRNDIFTALMTGADENSKSNNNLFDLITHILIYYKDEVVPGVILNLLDIDNCIFNNCSSYIMPVLHKYMNNELIQWMDAVKTNNDFQLMYYAWKGFLSTI